VSDRADRETTLVVQTSPLAVRPEVAAQLLGVGTSTVRELLRRGEIRGRKATDRPKAPVLIPVSELERWLLSRPLTGPTREVALREVVRP